MEHTEQLSIHTQDTWGFTPDPHILGDVLTHTGNNKEYTIIGFAWMSATDEWGFRHVAIGEHGVELVRPLWHLCGERSNGYTRYEEWESYLRYVVEHAVIPAATMKEPTD